MQKIIQYEEFEHDILFDIIPNKSENIRNGQAIMIYLNLVSRILYDKITATEFDCFYVDSNIPKTLNFLKENWGLTFMPINAFIENFSLKQVGKSYDFMAFFGFLFYTSGEQRKASKKWMCSELCFMAYKEAGINLLERWDAWKVSPTILSYNTKMKFIERIKT